MRSVMLRAVVLLVAFGALGGVPSIARAQSMDDFFDDGSVHEIRIAIQSRDWTALKENFTENTYYPVTLRWRDVTVPNVGIRSRGLGSRSGTKPGLRVDIDHYAAKQEFLGLKSFVLDNLVQDKSMIRERVTMKFLRRMGLPAPREAHARLFVNDQYAGMYAIVESLDKGFLGRNLGEDSDGGVENDGYLFEYDYTKEYRFEYLGSNLDEYKFFDPKTNEKKADAQIWGPLEDMIQAINESPDATFAQDMSRYLDLGEFAKYIALEAFIAEDDGVLGYAGLNNFYLYRYENSDRVRFLAWDKDNTFQAWDFPIMRNVNDNVLSRRTLNIEEYRNRYLDTLVEAAGSADEPELDEDGNPVSGGDNDDDNDDGEDGEEGAGPGWLEREIVRQFDQIRTLARADNFKPYSNDELEEEYQKLLEFARARSSYVRDEVANQRR